MKNILLLIGGLISSVASAQIRFESGYFIDNSGKKTECQIRNLDWNNNPEEFDYTLAGNDTPKKAKITEIKEFSIGSQLKYRRFTVNLDTSPADVSRLSSQKAPEWMLVTAFLKVLVEGKAILYQYNSTNMERFFFATAENAVPEQLVCKEYFSDFKIINTNNYFRQQILNSLKSDKIALADVHSLEYQQKPLSKVFLKYNESMEVKTTDYSERQTKSEWNFKALVDLGSAKMTGHYYNGTAHFNTGNVITYGLGIEAEVIFGMNKKKWSAFAAPTYSMFKYDGDFTSVSGTTKKFTDEYNTLTIPVGVRHYLFLSDKSKLFLNASMNFNFTIGGKFEYEGAFGTYQSDFSQVASFAAGAGFNRGPFWIEARFNLKHPVFTNNDAWVGHVNSINAIVSYKFM